MGLGVAPHGRDGLQRAQAVHCVILAALAVTVRVSGARAGGLSECSNSVSQGGVCACPANELAIFRSVDQQSIAHAHDRHDCSRYHMF